MPEKLNRRLDSWKEISVYLGRDVRTLLRWEKERGLPVHRVPGGKRHAVFAYREEIDRWLAGLDGAPDGHEIRAVAAPAVAGSRPGRARAWKAGLPAIAVIVALAGIAYIRGERARRQVLDIAVQGVELQALDAKGAVLWTHSFPWKVYVPVGDGMSLRRQVVDLDGDGRAEILVAATPDERAPGRKEPDYLYCFSPTGKVLWTFEFRGTLKFGDGEYGPPWLFGGLEVYDAGGEKRIAYAVNHNAWWPATLLILDRQGKLLNSFVSAGHVYRLVRMESASGPLLLAGGVSNANDAGMLMVLAPRDFPGSSPEEPGSAYECKGCSQGKPRHLFVFPRGELNVLTGQKYNVVNEVNVYPDRVEARARQHGWFGPAAIYEFSHAFELKRAIFDDGYWDFHRQLELEGKVTHSKAACSDRNGPPAVRAWEPGRGWREIRASVQNSSAK